MRQLLLALAIVGPILAWLAGCAAFPDSDRDDASRRRPSPSWPDAAEIADASGMVCMIDTTYSYGVEGGNTAWVDVLALTPPRTFALQRNHVPEADGQLRRPPEGCTTEIPTCGTGNGITTDDVMRAVNHPDVVRALAEVPSSKVLPVYGADLRPIDGQVFAFRRGNEGGFYVGEPCGEWASTVDTGCRPIPDGLAELMGLLLALKEQQLALSACSALP